MIITTKQALLGLAALGIGWILAGEPTSIDELRNGIDRLMGRHGGGGTGGYGYGPGGVPLIPGGLPSLNFDHPHHHDHGGGMMPGMMGGPGGGGSDPNTQSQLQQMQQQMMQQQQQSQMQQQQQQFQDQLAQQNQQAQMSQMQQQLQQAQQAAAAAAAGGGAAAQTAATQQQPLQQPQQPASNVPPSQQMTPSATAPGIVPQTQDQSMLGMAAGMDPSQMQMQQQMQQMQNPYAQQSPYGGMMGGMMGMGMPGQSPYAPSPYAPAMGTIGGGVGVPVGYGQPLFGTPMQNMFASSPNVLGNYQNVNVRPYGSVTNVSHPITGMTTYNRYGGGGSSGSWGGHYRSHLGIVDGDQEPHHRKPFFNHEHEVINMDLGNIYPGLDGVKVIDLIMSSPSKNADEIFPRGLNKYDYGGFEQDIHVYITRILEHMEGFNPQEKVGILKDVLQTYAQAHPFDAKFYPADPFTMNPLSHIPSKGAIIRSGLPLANEGMVYKTDGGYMLPDKYAALQMPNTNSMPPMIHHRRGSPANKKTLFFNGQ